MTAETRPYTRPMPRTVVLRPYEDRDLPGTLELRPRVYPGWKDAGDAAWHTAVYEWLGRNPVDAPMHRWVLDDGGAIVGHLAAVPLAYRIGGARVIAHTPTDYMALPGYGFHAVALMRTFFRAVESYAACNVAGEVSQIEGLFGPARVAGLQQAVKVLDLGRYPRLASPLLRPLASVAALSLRAIDAIRAPGEPNDGIEVDEADPATAFDASFDELFEAAASAVTCIPEKTSAFLRWRYGPDTPRPVRLLTARAAEGGLLGYSVARTTGSGGWLHPRPDDGPRPARRRAGPARGSRPPVLAAIERSSSATASCRRSSRRPIDDLGRLGFRFPGGVAGRPARARDPSASWSCRSSSPTPRARPRPSPRSTGPTISATARRASGSRRRGLASWRSRSCRTSPRRSAAGCAST